MTNNIVNIRCGFCQWEPLLRGPLSLNPENVTECYSLWFEHCQIAHGVTLDSEGNGKWPNGIESATFTLDLEHGTMPFTFAPSALN